MKLCFIAHQATKEGAGHFLLDQIDYLRSRNVEMLVIVPNHGQLREALIHRGVEARIIPHPWWTKREGAEPPFQATFQAARQIADVLTSWQAGVVYSQTIVSPAGAIAAALAGLPHIWHIHEFAYNPEAIDMAVSKSYLAAFMEQTCNAIVFNSQSVAREWDACLGSIKTVVVYNWTQARHETSEQTNLESDYPPANRLRNRYIFTHIASVIPLKRQFDSLRALQKLVSEGLDVGLLVVGPLIDARYQNDMLVYIREHELQDHIRFIGHTESPASFMKRSIATLVCSNVESFGRVTIESMAVGVPVVGADSGGTAEIIENEVSGLLFPPGNVDALAAQMRRLIQEAPLRKRLCDGGSERVKRFSSPDREMEPILGLLEDLSHEKNPSWPFGNLIGLGLYPADVNPASLSMRQLLRLVRAKCARRVGL